MMGSGGMSGAGMFFGGPLMWILLIVIVVVVIAVIKMAAGKSSGKTAQPEDTPLEILKKRYARGEIDETEFNQRCKKLED